MAYPEDSAGALMATDVLLRYIKAQHADKLLKPYKIMKMRKWFYIYITDDNSLVGIASLRALATTHPETKLKEIMVKKVHKVRPETDQEEVASL